MQVMEYMDLGSLYGESSVLLSWKTEVLSLPADDFLLQTF